MANKGDTSERPQRSSFADLLHHHLHQRRTLWIASAAMLLGVLAVLAFPVRNLYAQQDQIAETKAEIKNIEEANAALKSRTDALNNPDELELTARRNHGLVLPREESYSVMESPEAGKVPGWVSIGLAFDPAVAAAEQTVTSAAPITSGPDAQTPAG